MKNLITLTSVLFVVVAMNLQSNAQTSSGVGGNLDLNTSTTSNTLLIGTSSVGSLGGGGAATSNNNCSGSAAGNGQSDTHINDNDCQGCAESYARCVGTNGGNDPGCNAQLTACKIQFRCGW